MIKLAIYILGLTTIVSLSLVFLTMNFLLKHFAITIEELNKAHEKLREMEEKSGEH